MPMYPQDHGHDDPVERALNLLREEMGEALHAVVAIRSRQPVLGDPPRLVAVLAPDAPREKITTVREFTMRQSWVDRVEIEAVAVDELVSLGSRVRTVDIRGRGTVLYGPSAILESLPPVEGPMIPAEDGLALARAAIPLLLVGLTDGDFGQEISRDRARAMAAQASRAVQMAAEALLIEARAHPGATDQVEAAFRLRYARYREMVGLVRTAHYLQAHPEECDFDVVRYWIWARRLTLTAYFRLFARCNETPLADWWDMARFRVGGVARLSRWFWRLLGSRPLGGSSRSLREERLELATLFLLLARDRRRGTSRSYVKAARKQVGELTGQLPPGTWEPLLKLALTVT